ncbi:MAG TPA: tyrosine-type recombinase/integrase [Acidimicrobiales bacterium]|nr:tyrosine-type recombinase/integrase [Acidimicrobiales bacterium]
MASIHKRAAKDGSPRYDVRYRLASGVGRTKTFRNRKEAGRFAAVVEADKDRGGLLDPRAGKVTVADYAAHWLDGRPTLRPRTVAEYRGVLDRHVLPSLGAVELGRLDVATVRAWHAKLLRAGVGAPTVARSYRVLRAICATAVEDSIILANPCSVKGAGQDHSPERPVATPEQVWELAASVPGPRRCLVVLAGFLGLRLGECLGLAVRHVDLLHGLLVVEQQLIEMPDGSQVLVEPKTEAGRRLVPLPSAVAAELEEHLGLWAGTGPDGWLFHGVKGGARRRHVFNAEFRAARAAVGLDQLHFHDLRHSALTLAAATGATVAELQALAGHASPQAAMRYQHATMQRARALAEAVDQVISCPVPVPERRSGSGRSVTVPLGS